MSNAVRQGTPDERFALPVEASRRGAHRARPNPLLGALPLAAVAVVVIGVVALAYALFFRGGGTDSSGGASLTTASSTPGTSAAASQPAASAGASAAASQAATPSVATSPSAGATGTVDRALTLNFYNGSNPQVPGLSRKAAAKFPAKKWKTGVIQPWTGQAVTSTTVFYATPEQAATAEAVVKVLGVGAAKLAPDQAAKGLSVVISNDFTP